MPAAELAGSRRLAGLLLKRRDMFSLLQLLPSRIIVPWVRRQAATILWGREIIRRNPAAPAPAKPTLMNRKSKSNMRNQRRSRRPAQRTNETVALFLGPKLLGELRILMRIASNGRTEEVGAKSF